jgi:hypothetical protein
LTKELANSSFTWLKVAFFILSRADSNFDVSMASALMPDVLNEIVDLIESENYGLTLNPPTDEEFEEPAGNQGIPEGK